MSGKVRLILIVIVVAGIGGVIAFAAASLKADQDAAVARYGADAIALCKNNIDTDMSGRLPGDAKIAFIDAGLSTIHNEYQSKLAAGNAAADKAALTHVACTKQVDFLYDEDKYGASGKYTCKRYSKNLDVALYDVKTGKQVAYWKIDGEMPPTCPERTDKSLTKYGNPPIAADVFSALGL
jgi:hypothetical protein